MHAFNFEEDLKSELHNAFSDFGVRLPFRKDLHQFILDFLTISKKIVRPQKRDVLYNPEFYAKLQKHPRHDEIKNLEKYFRNGENVNYHQSKRLFQANFHDHLVYEWDIFHFHLSFEKEHKSNFTKQTKQLLFAYITDSTVVFLGTDNHSEGTFGDTKWVEILHKNFPDLIMKYRDSHTKSIDPDFSAIERQKAWDSGVLIGISEIQGVVYNSPGIGRASSGHSVLVVKQCHEILRWLHNINEQFEKHYDAICSHCKVSSEDALFRLKFGAKTFEIVEEKSMTSVLTYPEIINSPIP